MVCSKLCQNLEVSRDGVCAGLILLKPKTIGPTKKISFEKGLITSRLYEMGLPKKEHKIIPIMVQTRMKTRRVKVCKLGFLEGIKQPFSSPILGFIRSLASKLGVLASPCALWVYVLRNNTRFFIFILFYFFIFYFYE